MHSPHYSSIYNMDLFMLTIRFFVLTVTNFVHFILFQVFVPGLSSFRQHTSNMSGPQLSYRRYSPYDQMTRVMTEDCCVLCFCRGHLNAMSHVVISESHPSLLLPPPPATVFTFFPEDSWISIKGEFQTLL